MSEATDDVQRSGYLSEASKRHFTIVTGVLGVVFFVLQFVVPMGAMLVLMPAIFMEQAVTTYDVRGACVFQGHYYVVESTQKLDDGSRVRKSRLVRLASGGIEEVQDLDGWTPRLAAAADRIWLVSPEEVGWYDGASVRREALAERLGEISAPILVDGQPVVAEVRPDGARLLGWSGEAWTERLRLESAGKPCCFQLLDSPSGVLLFREDGNTLFVRSLEEAAGEWKALASSPSSWYAFSRGGVPAVAAFDASRTLQVFERRDGTWKSTESLPAAGWPRSFMAAQAGPSDPLQVLQSGFPGSLSVRTARDGKLDDGEQLGTGSPFPGQFLYMMLLMQASPALLSLLLAVVLSSLMKSHRVGVYAHEGRVAPQASLTRRAIAQLVDGALMLAPPLVVAVRFFGDLERMADGPESFVQMFGWMGATLGWLIFTVALFSFAEGRWGTTPGKWATGIRVVGTDLEPCGFGRAIIRNLLKFADGFFNFLVGILMVAFTPEWQRLGDLAARTVVIHASAGEWDALRAAGRRREVGEVAPAS